MFKRRQIVPGEAPGSLKLPKGLSTEPPVITLIEYDVASLEERVIVDTDELCSHLSNERVTWINIDGLGDISVLRLLGQRFNLHPLALEDVLDTSQRPKVEQYDDYLFIVAKMLYLTRDKEIGGEQVSMFLGKTFLITLQEEGDFDVFEPVRARIRPAAAASAKPGRIISPTPCSIPLSTITTRCWNRSARRLMRSRMSWLIIHWSDRSEACMNTNERLPRFDGWFGHCAM